MNHHLMAINVFRNLNEVITLQVAAKQAVTKRVCFKLSLLQLNPDPIQLPNCHLKTLLCFKMVAFRKFGAHMRRGPPISNIPPQTSNS